MEYILGFQRDDNSFKALITDRFYYWQKELVSVLLYGSLYSWVFSFYILIRERQSEFPIYLPLSIGMFIMCLWTMNRFQAEISLKHYPKYYFNKNQWNRNLFDRFLHNRLIVYLKKRGWRKEQIQIIRPEVKETADKIISQSLLKRIVITILIELVITQFLTSMELQPFMGEFTRHFLMSCWGIFHSPHPLEPLFN
jgi:hypothetical protein